MTDEEIRIKVAELLGFTEIYDGIIDDHYGANVDYYGLIGKDKVGYIVDLPDYLFDLNACHEMVETLRKEDDSKWYDFRKHLMDECGSVMNAIQATERQRCEAFIKTMEGK